MQGSGPKIGDARAMLAKAVKPVVESLEQRKLLSAVLDDTSGELPKEDQAVEVTLGETDSEDSAYFTLEATDEGLAATSEMGVEGEEGSVPEEWMSYTSWMVDEEGGETTGEEGSVPEEWMSYTSGMVDEEGGEATGEKGEIVEGETPYPEEWIYFTTTSIDGDDGEWNEPYPRNTVELTTGDPGDLPEDVVPIAAQIVTTRLRNNGTLVVKGTSGNDVIGVKVVDGNVVVTSGATVIKTVDADDVDRIKIEGRGGDDTITLDASVTIDARIRGQAGDDTVTGGSGDDRITGGAGDDTLDGKAGQDRVHGNAGDDAIAGGSDADDLSGGHGKDKVRGGKGGDAIRGGRGRDKIAAGAGNDLIDGGTENDRLMAGAGTDGTMDPNDVILDADADDAKFATTRIAKPGWWQGEGDDLGAICLADPDPELPPCDDTPMGDEPLPIWWNDGDPNENGGTADAGRHAWWYEGDDYNDTGSGELPVEEVTA